MDNYVCGTYKRKRDECSAHYIRSVVLETLVLENLQKVISCVKAYEDDFVRQVTENKLAEQEQRSLERSSAELRKSVDAYEKQSLNIKSFLKCVKKYTEPHELTPDILHELVEKIVVYAPDKSSEHRTQQIDIYYNFVGKIPLSKEIATKQTA